MKPHRRRLGWGMGMGIKLRGHKRVIKTRLQVIGGRMAIAVFPWDLEWDMMGGWAVLLLGREGVWKRAFRTKRWIPVRIFIIFLIVLLESCENR